MSKKIQLVLTEVEAISLEKILEYLWEDESESYEVLVEEFDETNDTLVPTNKDHIFYHIYKVNQKLQVYKTKKINTLLK